MRIAGADMVIGEGSGGAEVLVRRGDSMLLLLAAAHRDPDAFERPDDFDPDREDLRHLAFGKGPHFCLGAPLARLEAQTVFTRLAERFARIEPAGMIPRFLTTNLRGVPSLPVRVSPR
jgi:cytochrome P450